MKYRDKSVSPYSTKLIKLWHDIDAFLFFLAFFLSLKSVFVHTIWAHICANSLLVNKVQSTTETHTTSTSSNGNNIY